MGDQTLLVSRQEREANAKNQPMFRKRLFKDILIAISGSFRTGTSNAACCMMSYPWLPFTLTIGKLWNRAQQNIPEDNIFPLSWHVTHITWAPTDLYIYIYIDDGGGVIYVCRERERGRDGVCFVIWIEYEINHWYFWTFLMTLMCKITMQLI